jgi:hypothetical protein
MRITSAVLTGCLIFSAPVLAADNDKPCLTKEQARAKWPGQWLYWHTANRCWDNINVKSTHARSTAAAIRSKPAVWGRENSLKLAKPSGDANGNVVHHGGRPIIMDPVGPSIFYPTVIAGGGTSDNMLQAESINRWPVIVDFDVDPPLFIPWNERISSVFDLK